MKNGYLVNLFKYPPADIDSIRNVPALKNRIPEGNTELVRNVVWSNFDRIEIRRIEKFEKYRMAEESEKNWIGERQFTLLYDLVNETDARLIYRKSKESDDHCRFTFEPTGISLERRDDYRFFGISMVTFSPTMHQYVYKQSNPGEVIHTKISKILKDLCDSSSAEFLNENLRYEIYGTLGSADCAIIWLVNQYTDVIALVEALRKTKCNEKEYVTSNIYTIMGLANPCLGKNDFEGTKGLFCLRLIKRGSFAIETFKEKLKKYVTSIGDINIVLGKYDACVTFESAAITRNLYEENGLIHFRTEEYYEPILEAYTELMQKPEDGQIEPINYKNAELIEQDILVETKTDHFDEVKEKIENVTQAVLFNELPYLKETLWLLYQDYIKNMASEFSHPWSIDLEYAFLKSIEYMQEILGEEDEQVNGERIEFILSFINSIRQTILHISQAGRLYFETPNSHLKQTGAYSKILYAYYGIIKKMLKIAYHIPRLSAQSEIIPFITFNVKPKVESEFFESSNKEAQRVVNFELPYEALTNLPKYSKLLAHEVFHYIAPDRRDIRNYLYGCIFWTEIIKDICNRRFCSLYTAAKKSQFKYDRWQEDCGRVIYFIKEDIWNSVLDNYELLMSAYVEDERCLWSEYCENMVNKAGIDYSTNETSIYKIVDIIHPILNKIVPSLLSTEQENKDFKVVLEAIDSDIKKVNYQEDFLCWYLSNDRLKYTGIKANDVIYACREALADYFMIQLMQMDIKEYIITTFNFAAIYESFGEMQLAQQFRISIILDYIWSAGKELTDKKIRDSIEGIGLADEQLEQLYICWDNYEKYAMIYRNIFHYLLDTIKFDKLEHQRSIKDLWDSAIEEFNEKIVMYTQPSEEKDFEYNRILIENMQNQEPLKEIFLSEYQNDKYSSHLRTIADIKSQFKIKKSDTKEALDLGKSYKSMAIVQSLEGFMRTFEDIVGNLRDDITEPLWFRGHCSSEYKLIPSLYRLNYTKAGSLKPIMEDFTNTFRVKAFHVPEIFPGGNSSLLSTMVSMQHYKVDTNLLDWSQQIFSALYFALEDYINDPNKAVPQKNARVYIMNPARFNTMLRKILDSKMTDGHYAIPALLNDDDKYARYLPFLNPKDGTDADKEYNYPFAMYAPYVNPRIKAQAGCFTIFSININAPSKMEYELEELQEECRKKNKEEFLPFLAYVDIDREYVKDVAKSIRAMGITKKDIYPELSTIAEEMKKEIKSNYVDEKKKS